MEFNIEYINTYGNVSCFDINGYQIKFLTKSERDVMKYLQDMESILINKLKFESINDLNTDVDIFRAIEYFSKAHPDIVKDYFLTAKKNILSELEKLEMRRQATIKSAYKYICGIPITECSGDEKIKYLAVNIPYNLKSTQKILNDIFHKRNADKNLNINKCYSLPFGVLTCLGIKYYTNSYLWELNRIKNIIFDKSDNDIDILATKIINTLSEVHEKVTNKIIDKLVDFTDLNDMKIMMLYTKAYPELIKQYIQLIIQNYIKDGQHILRAGGLRDSEKYATGGVSTLTILQLLSKNQDNYRLSEARKSRSMTPFLKICSNLIDEYMVKQVNYRIQNNEFDINRDKWTYYYTQLGRLRHKTFTFTELKNSSVKREFKLYIKQLIEVDSQTKNTLRKEKSLSSGLMNYTHAKSGIDYFITEHGINSFADITPEMVAEFLSDLEYNGLKGREKTSIRNLLSCKLSIARFSNWIFRNADKIKSQKPDTDVFLNVIFKGSHLLTGEVKGTDVIPEFILNQIIANLHFLKPTVYKRLFLCLLNTPRRIAELQRLEIGSVHPVIEEGDVVLDKYGKPLYRLIVIEHKKHKNKQIDNNGLNYDVVTKILPLNHIAAREIAEQEKETKKLEAEINSQRLEKDKVRIKKVFVRKDESLKNGYSVINTTAFNGAIKTFLKDCNVKDENGDPWHFTTKQTRTTGTDIMVQNGESLDSIQTNLGHDDVSTTFNSYITLANLHIADTNTEFMRSQFDNLFSEQTDIFDEDELIALFNKYCLDYNKIYYNRKLLGVCGLKIGEKCPKAEDEKLCSLNDELPCADCSALYVGKSCEKGWETIHSNCESALNVFQKFFEDNNILLKKAFEIQEYKLAYIKYLKSKKVLEAIESMEGG